MYRAGDTYKGMFTTHNYGTGQVVNADALPGVSAFKEGVLDPTFVISVVGVDTGVYNLSGVIPTSYADGTMVHVLSDYSVSGVERKIIVENFFAYENPQNNTNLQIGGAVITIE